MTISNFYIEKAAEIRIKYTNYINKINSILPDIEEYKKELEKEYKKLNNEILNKDHNLIKKEDLNNKLNIIEENIVNIQNKLKPYFDKIESLKNESSVLNNNIKEKYPNLSDDDIRNIIVSELKKRGIK